MDCDDRFIQQSTVPTVVVIGYNRPELLKRCLESLSQQSLLPERVVCFIDGPQQPQDVGWVEQSLQVCLDAQSELPIELVARPSNRGCNENILSALEQICAECDRFVYIEDDVILSPHYLETMAALLEVYRAETELFSILPLCHPDYDDDFLASLDHDFFVTNRFSPQGFASWSNRWTQAVFKAARTPAFNPYGNAWHIPAYRHIQSLIPLQLHNEWFHPQEWSLASIFYHLKQNNRHLCSRESMIYNIGFGHPLAVNTKTPSHSFNKRYNPSWQPQTYPKQLALHPQLTEKPRWETDLALRLRLLKLTMTFIRRKLVKHLKRFDLKIGWVKPALKLDRLVGKTRPS